MKESVHFAFNKKQKELQGSLDEQPTHYRGSRRALAQDTALLRGWLRSNPADERGYGFYMQAGRDRLFFPTDLDRIEARIRELTPCPSSSSRRVKAKARTGRYVARTSTSQLTEAQELIGRPLQIGSSNRSSGPSNVVS